MDAAEQLASAKSVLVQLVNQFTRNEILAEYSVYKQASLALGVYGAEAQEEAKVYIEEKVEACHALEESIAGAGTLSALRELWAEYISAHPGLDEWAQAIG